MSKHALKTIHLPEAALHTLALQRPSYRNLPLVKAERLFLSELESFREQIQPFFPRGSSEALNILDIGCGIGFGTVTMRTMYGPNNNFFALDRSVVDDAVYYGFEQIASSYNKLAITEEVLLTNGIEASRANIIDIDKVKFPMKPKFDIIISIIAWGFHFPIKTYIEQVLECSRKGGFLMVDIRHGTDGVEVLAKSHQLISALPDRKFVRTFWKRN